MFALVSPELANLPHDPYLCFGVGPIEPAHDHPCARVAESPASPSKSGVKTVAQNRWPVAGGIGCLWITQRGAVSRALAGQRGL